MYGSNYCLPRIYTKYLAEKLRWMYKNNVRSLGGEYFPNGNWQDALKIYVWHKLAWNINADVDAIVEKYQDYDTGIYRYATAYREKDIMRKLRK